jgi:hypothetical protein
MNKLIATILVVTVTGCAVPGPPDYASAAAAMPNDCANRNAIIRWLEAQASIPRQPMESEAQYANTRSQIRSRIWSVRYTCQPV